MNRSPPSYDAPILRNLPERIIVGYANWNQCDEKIIQAVKDGVNVVIWFATNLAISPDGTVYP